MSSTTPAATPTAPTTLNANTDLGVTTIDDSVVAKVAGIAARQVPGVHDLGGGAARAIGALRERINQSDMGQGISVQVGETETSVAVTLIADYPTPLQQLADGVRAAVIDAVESLVGLRVTGVDVRVTDVVLPTEQDEDAATTTA